jgi:sugar-specific transcriptional regulator TrmB
MNTRTILLRLGISPLSAEVWMALEGNEPLTISALATKSGKHRPSVYRSLAQLGKAGLVCEAAKGARTAYRTISQKELLVLWKNIEQPQVLYSAHEVRANTPRTVTKHSGDSAIRDAFDHVVATLKRGDTFFRVTSEKNLDEVNALLSPTYRKHRDAKRLERLVISNRESGNRKRRRLERFIRYIETEPFAHDVIELIYGAYVTFIDLKSKEVTRIHNIHIASFERSKFKALYDKLPRPL